MLFNIDEATICKIEEFNNLLVNHFAELDKSTKNNKFDKIATAVLKNRILVVRNTYSKLASIDSKQNKRKIGRLSILYPKTFMGAIYLQVLLDEAHDTKFNLKN